MSSDKNYDIFSLKLPVNKDEAGEVVAEGAHDEFQKDMIEKLKREGEELFAEEVREKRARELQTKQEQDRERMIEGAREAIRRCSPSGDLSHFSPWTDNGRLPPDDDRAAIWDAQRKKAEELARDIWESEHRCEFELLVHRRPSGMIDPAMDEWVKKAEESLREKLENMRRDDAEDKKVAVTETVDWSGFVPLHLVNTPEKTKRYRVLITRTSTGDVVLTHDCALGACFDLTAFGPGLYELFVEEVKDDA